MLDNSQVSDLTTAATLLRAAGYTVLPPPSADIPRVEVGQVWVSPNPRVEARTVVAIGPVEFWPSAGDRVVRYVTRDGNPADTRFLKEPVFVAWARKSGARPVEPPQVNAAETLDTSIDVKRLTPFTEWLLKNQTPVEGTP